MNLRLARFPSVDRLWNFSWQLCPMHRDLQAVSVISGGGETECIHCSVRCLAAKVTDRGCHLLLDPLHVQISKIQTAIGREENTVETCSEQVYRSQEALTKAQHHLWEIQGRLEQVALRKEEEDQGYGAMALQDGPGSGWDADSPGSNDVEGHDTPAEAECVCCRLWLCRICFSWVRVTFLACSLVLVLRSRVSARLQDGVRTSEVLPSAW